MGIYMDYYRFPDGFLSGLSGILGMISIGNSIDVS